VGVILQFVDAHGRVALAWGDDEPLPASTEPTRLEAGERITCSWRRCRGLPPAARSAWRTT
jgi:hypothetical protein